VKTVNATQPQQTGKISLKRFHASPKTPCRKTPARSQTRYTHTTEINQDIVIMPTGDFTVCPKHSRRLQQKQIRITTSSIAYYYRNQLLFMFLRILRCFNSPRNFEYPQVFAKRLKWPRK